MSAADQGPLARFALRMTAISERWLPDAFLFALAGTAIVLVAGLTVGGGAPVGLVKAWGNGFWSLVPFTMQMALIVITGTVVATSPPVQRAIDGLASMPRSNRQATVFVAVASMASSWFNWGFGLLFAAFLARSVARKVPGVDYRTLCATTLLGLGTVWAQGLSGSAALQMATPGMLPPAIRAIVAGKDATGATIVPDGILPLSHTIFLWQSFASVAIEILVVAALVWLITPTGNAVRTAQDLGVDLSTSDIGIHATAAHGTPGEWLEHQWWVNGFVVALGLVYLCVNLAESKSIAAAITLNTLNLGFLVAGFALHRTPARLMRAFAAAVPATWGFLLQFPFYGGIAAIITDTHLNQRIADVFTSVASPLTYPPLVAAYSAVLGVFVPSGGSKWVIEAPYVMQAAHDLKVHLGWMVAVYDLGEALANLVQPFWMLPVLGLLGVKARDIMGVTWTVFVVMTPVVLALVTLLGATLRYPL
jgi:short-chain fatty acids transporter